MCAIYRLEEEGYKPAKVSDSSPILTSATVAVTITLKELSEKTEVDDLKKSFQSAVKITAIEDNGSWWYLSCTCQHEVVKVENMFKCPKENKLIPVVEKRFKIAVLDGDATGAFNFVLHDSAVKRIVGQTTMKMIFNNPTLDESTGYPAKIKEIFGQELIFNVQISDDNVNLKSKIFEVLIRMTNLILLQHHLKDI
ncbi:hypothetical protein AgCh_025238 [Apium graveolens]